MSNYRIYNWRSHSHFEQLISYIVIRQNRPQKLIAEIIKKINNTKMSDAQIYKYIDLYIVPKIPEKNYLSRALDFKLDAVDEFFKEHELPSIPLFLDIGTEDNTVLNELERIGANIKARACGVNIDTGFEHYETYQQSVKDERIKIYNGRDLPFDDNSIGLITIFSVLHHVIDEPKSCENITALLSDVRRVMAPGAYLIIKENNICNKFVRDAFDIQHEIYEKKCTCYRRHFTVDELIKYVNLPLIKRVDYHNFTQVVYLYFQKQPPNIL